MILHLLEVEGFQCFVQRTAIQFDPERINLLNGPNGSGKSTLLWALIRALFDTFRAGGQAVEALRPWGTDLSPHITVEFEDRGTLYRLRKSFLHDREARLERKQGKVFIAVATGEKAEDRVREMLLAERPAAGPAKPRHWGMARALWCPQDHLIVDSLEGRLLSNLQGLLGAQVLSKEGLQLKGKIKALYREYWTEGGKPRRGQDAPLFMRLEQELREAQEALKQAEMELEQLRDTQQDASRLQGEVSSRERLSNEVRNALAEAQNNVEQYVPLVHEQQKLKAQYENAQTQWKSLQERLRGISDLRKKVEASAESCHRLRPQLAEAERAHREALELFTAADEALKGATASGSIVMQNEKELETARSYVQNLERLAQLESQLQQLKGIETDLQRYEEERVQLRAPEKALLKELQRLQSERTRAEVLLDRALLHLEFMPAEARTVRVVHGEPLGPRQVEADQIFHVTGSPMLEVELERFGKVRCTGPGESASELKQTLVGLDEKIRELTLNFGTGDLGELARRREAADEIDLRIEAVKSAARTLLGDSSIQTLGGQAESLRAALAQDQAVHSEWSAQPPELDVLRARLTESKRAHEDGLRQATEAWQRAQGEVAAARERANQLQQRLEHARNEHEERQNQLQRLESDGLTDPQRQQESDALAMEAQGLKAILEEVERKLRDFPADPRPEHQRLSEEARKAEAAHRAVENQLLQLKGALKNLTARAPYERKGEAAEHVANVEHDLKQDLLRAHAIKLLQETIEECEQEAVSGVAEPVAKRATKLLHRIAGKKLGALSLDETLAPQAVAPPEVGEEVELSALSGGETEQVHLATRLALAELLTKDAKERHLVVLDDVLAATDDGRLQRVLKILEEMQQYAQFLVLTCHLERYKPLKDVHLIDLAALRH